MPLYDFACRDCGERFERLVRGETPVCPSCDSTNLERLLSSFGVSSQSTRQTNLARARKDGEKIRREKQHAEAEAARHHHDEH
jgi:putative FmdB family regulatory protein